MEKTVEELKDEINVLKKALIVSKLQYQLEALDAVSGVVGALKVKIYEVLAEITDAENDKLIW